MDAAAVAENDVAVGVIGVDGVAVGAAVFLMLPCALAVRTGASGAEFWVLFLHLGHEF